MKRIGTGDSLFHDGDPLQGTLGTIVTADWLNTMQEEVAAGIEVFSPINPADGAQLAKILAAGASNYIINGCCRVAQGATANLSTSSQYGRVDQFRVKGAGTAVSAGAITQDAAATIGSYGCALHVSGVTLTGVGVLYVLHRIEARDAIGLKNQLASFQAKVLHDTGANVDFTVTVRKPTVADNFAATTDIQSGYTTVASAVGTTIKLENINMGDCSNGIEIEIKVECGAVANKNFHFADFQLNKGAICTQLAHRPMAETVAACQRSYQKSYELGTAPGTATAVDTLGFYPPTATFYLTVPFRVTMRTTPAVTLYSPSGAAAKMETSNGPADINGGISANGTNGLTVNTTVAVANWTTSFHYTADCRL